MAFGPGHRCRGICRNPDRNVYLLLAPPLVSTGGGGIPRRLAKRMADCLTRFTIRVSRGPGSCSAVKLKCIIPIPISTTPDATIVQIDSRPHWVLFHDKLVVQSFSR